MARTFTQLSAIQFSYEEAERAWARSDYESVVRDLPANSDENRVLLARSYIRMRNYDAVIECLNGLKPTNPGLKFEAEIILAYVKDIQAKSSGPFQATFLGQVVLPRSVSSQTKAIYSFYRAYTLLAIGEVAEASAEAVKTSKSSSLLYRAWGFDLLGWINVLLKQFSIAHSHFAQCISLLDRQEPIDNLKRLNALHGYAFTTVETLDGDSLSNLIMEANRSVSPLLSRRLSTQIIGYAAIADSLLGNDQLAFAKFQQMLVDAPAGPFKALANLELSNFHKRRGSPDAAALHIEVAKQILDGTEWQLQDDEARMLLLLFAAEAASIDTPAASRMFTKAMNLSGKKDPALAFDKDGRSKALAFYAKGRIEAASEKVSLAIDSIEAARRIWCEIAYSYRALIAELDLLELGAPVTSRLQNRVLRELPSSWLARRAKVVKQQLSSPLKSISDAEQKVVEGICEGLTSKQIAKRLGRSPSTIRNQTLSLYSKLGVNTRSALVALVLKNQ